MDDNARKTISRAKEFDLIFSFLRKPDSLHNFIKSSPTGGSTSLEGIKFEYGKVKQFAEHLNKTKITNPFNTTPSFVCHLDRISSVRKRQLEIEFDTNPFSISGNQVKADIFFVDHFGEPYFVSVKDDLEPSKLGQLSTAASFGKAHLSGGLRRVQLPTSLIPQNFDFRQTALTESKFRGCGSTDRKYAYFKNNHIDEWLQIVEPVECNATEQVQLFCQTITNDKNSFVEFLGKTLAGNLKDSPNFYLLIGKSKIKFAKTLSVLCSLDFEITTERRPSKNDKTSQLVWLTVLGKKYCITKIEYSFEGKHLISPSTKRPVSQTKGIVFHFQQWPKIGNHYKKLLLDLTK